MSYNYFTFDGVASSDYGVYTSGNQTFNAPSRDYTEVIVPGRDGVLTLDNNRFNAIPHIYNAFIIDNFNANIKGLRNALMAKRGQLILTDTYHTDEFYKAYYEKGLEADVAQFLRAGEFEIEFTRDPRRFLTSGNTPTTLSASGTITNPTLFDAYPLITVTGTGELGVNGESITINYNTSTTTIDCEMKEIYNGTTNLGLYVELDEFPTLSPGSNNIVLGDGITSVIITPRWYIL